VHADHLNTPRAILDGQNRMVWRWLGSAFGQGLPEEDPDGDGKLFEYNLRFPGQYYDKETGLHYNYFRDYDPGTGRYVQSDPIGLEGGVNTYGYANQNPLAFTDALGLMGSRGRRPPQQDMVCSSVGALLENNSCVRECCVKHDTCYEFYGCSQYSWLGNLFGLASQCQICNAEAAICVTHARSNCDGEECK
jgi:RHS repeat-associated protein